VRALTGDVEPAPPALAGAIAAIERDIERAGIQLAAGRTDDARGEAARAVAAARALGYRPVLAEALLVDGRAWVTPADRAAASLRLAEATALGLSAGSESVAIEAWARRAWVEGTGPHPEAALDGFAVIDALATRTPSAFARALLHNNAGSVELGRGHRDVARDQFEHALDEARPVTGAGAVELIAIRTNTALAIDDLARRDALLDGAHAEFARLLGDHHPDALSAEFIRANTTVVSFARAAELITAVCRARELHSWLAAVTATCWLEAADLQAELGDRTAALAALDRGQRFGSDANPETREAAGYQALWRGDPAAATAAFTGPLAELAPRADEPWYRGYARARLALGLGRALAAQHRPDAAADALDGAIAVLEPLARDQRRVAIDRRLGRARAELARIRAALGGPPAATRALAADALAWLRSAGAPTAELAELAQLTAGSPR
jgi:tetratricopeptide (TPR) repeat protein